MWASGPVGFSMHSVDEEEKDLAVYLSFADWVDDAWVHDYLIITRCLILKLFACNLNPCVFLCSNLTAQDLIRSCYNLMKREFELTD